MKTLSLIILIFFSVNSSFAQVEFPKLNATWCYQAYGDHGEHLYQICYSTDSIIDINGILYSRIKYQQNLYDTMHTIYYREENSKFFILPKDSINEILLCDFNLNIGDTFNTRKWGWNEHEDKILTVYDIGIIVTLDGVLRKVIHLGSNDGEGYQALWIEGLGNAEWNFLYPNYRGSISGGFMFIGHCADGEMI